MRNRKSVIILTNGQRADKGRRSLKRSPLLMRSAQSKARHMARTGDFNHGTWWTRFAKKIRKPWGENIARGQNTPVSVTKAWWNSPGHRENILNEEFRLIGVGFARSKSGDEFWVQHFGG